MIKIDSMVIDNRKINLAFDTAAMMATEERFGSMGGVIEAVNAEDKPLRAKLDFILICAAGGQRHKPMDKGELDEEWMLHHSAPHEMNRLLALAIENASVNMSGKERSKDKPVDVVLEEIEGKNVQG